MPLFSSYVYYSGLPVCHRNSKKVIETRNFHLKMFSEAVLMIFIIPWKFQSSKSAFYKIYGIFKKWNFFLSFYGKKVFFCECVISTENHLFKLKHSGNNKDHDICYWESFQIEFLVSIISAILVVIRLKIQKNRHNLRIKT